MENYSNFSELTKANKIWAIGSLHSSLDSFKSIKKYILSNFESGDKLVFLGNLIGFRTESKKIIGEGTSKKNAQQNAAEKLIRILKIWIGKMNVICYQKINSERMQI